MESTRIKLLTAIIVLALIGAVCLIRVMGACGILPQALPLSSN